MLVAFVQISYFLTTHVFCVGGPPSWALRPNQLLLMIVELPARCPHYCTSTPGSYRATARLLAVTTQVTLAADWQNIRSWNIQKRLFSNNNSRVATEPCPQTSRLRVVFPSEKLPLLLKLPAALKTRKEKKGNRSLQMTPMQATGGNL